MQKLRFLLAFTNSISHTTKPVVARDIFFQWQPSTALNPLTHDDPNVWGMLTGISHTDRTRHQGIDILLKLDEHCFGRATEGVNCRLQYASVSANHCKMYCKKAASQDAGKTFTSTNGTYRNWERLRKNGPEVQVNDGDIVSFSAPLDNGNY